MLGHQRPRIWCAPPNVGSRGQEAIDLAAMAGLQLDPWQQWVMHRACAVKEETFLNDHTGSRHNKWAAKDVGLVVARQNGKGSILEARELAGLFLFGEKEIIHTSQDASTSMKHYRRIESLMRNTKELNAEVKGYYESNGKERIELRNGACIFFKTRTKKLARGFSPQLVVLDEAMFLDAEIMAALLPTVSAQPNPQFWYTGSAGTKESLDFGRVRIRALKDDPDPYLFFAEWSIDACNDFCLRSCTEHDPIDSVESYAKANPGLGIRISLDTIRSEQLQLPEEKFLIERLSVGDWPVDGDAWAVIGEEAWRAREDESSAITGKPFVLAVDTSPGPNLYSSIAVCGANRDGDQHVEITGYEQYDARPGTTWVVPRVLELWKSVRPEYVVIDRGSQAATFIDELEKAGVRVLTTTAPEYALACSEFYSGIVPRRGESASITHIGQEPLTMAVAGAEKRDLADKWAWNKRTSSTDITPLVAVTLAAWGHRKLLNKPRPRPRAVFA